MYSIFDKNCPNGCHTSIMWDEECGMYYCPKCKEWFDSEDVVNG